MPSTPEPELPPSGQPLTFSPHPKLDHALQMGWPAWIMAARTVGAETVASWMARRLGDAAMQSALLDPVRVVLGTEDVDVRAVATAELAELAEDQDDLLADTLWDGVLAAGRRADDPDLIFEATVHLSAIAEAHGDPLAAAEYYMDFLNWRRIPSHVGEPEAVETAFDEIIRLAQLDGAQEAVARWEYRQAGYARLLDAGDDRATEGDWERDPAPYAGWE